MGTRNLTMVILNKEVKVAQYGQWGGYPSGNGQIVLSFLQKVDIDAFKSKVSLIKELSDYEIKSAGSNWESKYPQVSRDVGPDVLDMIYKGEIDSVSLQTGFIYDSLFCEWAYLIDLDDNKLEVYKGFSKSKLEKDERFYKDEPNSDGYYACKMIAMFEIDNLPSSFSDDGYFIGSQFYEFESSLKSKKREIKITKIIE